MLIDYKYARNNIRIVNFDYILRETFDLFCCEAIKYGLVDDLSTKSSRTMFIHSLIVSLCERIKCIPSDERVLLYVNSESYMIPDTNRADFIDIISKTLKILPFKAIWNTHNIEMFCYGVSNNKTEDTILLEQGTNSIINYDVLKFSHKKLQRFLKTNKLLYLYSVYFTQVTNKLLATR